MFPAISALIKQNDSLIYFQIILIINYNDGKIEVKAFDEKIYIYRKNDKR